jgi:hypothetical protein
MCDAESMTVEQGSDGEPFIRVHGSAPDPLDDSSSGGGVSPGAETVPAVQSAWSEPDMAGIRHYRGAPPPPATVLDAHTYIGPRIEAGYDRPTAFGVMEPALRIVCVCGWNSDPLPGVLLADAAVLYADHLLEVTDA